MTNTDRDTHFQNFAKNTIDEINGAYSEDEEIIILAQRAYDLVKHTLDHCTSGQDFDVIYHEDAIPDMLVLPEVKE